MAETAPLREITGCWPRTIRVEYWALRRETENTAAHLVKPRRRTRIFDLQLSCGHELRVPFGRRPKQGRSIRCDQCLEGNEQSLATLERDQARR